MRVNQSDIFHMRGMSTDGVDGLSVVSAHRESIGVSNLARQHGFRSLRNGVKFPGLLKMDKTFKDNEQRAQFRKDFEAMSGGDNIGRTPVLENGMDWVTVGMSNLDAQYIETRRFEKSEIAGLFGVPLFMLNDTEKSTTWGTGLEQLSAAFVRFTLQPWATVIEQTIKRDLIASRDQFAKFDFDDLLRGSLKERSEAFQIQRRNGAISANEWREREGLDPRTDPAGDEFIIEANMSGSNEQGESLENEN